MVGQAYRLERSPDLTDGTWTEVITLTTTGTVTSFTDPQRLTGSRNFWRVVVIGGGPDSVPAFTFEGIGVAGDPDGTLKHNHIRLARDSSGTGTFTVKSEQQFLACRQRMKLSIVTGGSPKISGSMEGNFCVLPEPISLKFDSSKACQFEGAAFGFTIRFGTGCAEVTW